MDHPADWLPLGLSSLFILLGAWVTAHSLRVILLGWKARRWPRTEGLVVSSESSEIRQRKTVVRELKVRYSYQVGGTAHEGSTIHPCRGGSISEGDHRRLKTLLHRRQRVEVHYDPRRPGRSTLATGFYSSSLAPVFVGLVLVIMGGGFGFLLHLSKTGHRDFLNTATAGLMALVTLGFGLIFWFARKGKSDYAGGISLSR